MDTPYAQRTVNGVVCEIAYTLFTGCFQDSFDTQIWSEKYKERCKSLTDYIDEHYSEDISLESLSENSTYQRPLVQDIQDVHGHHIQETSDQNQDVPRL